MFSLHWLVGVMIYTSVLLGDLPYFLLQQTYDFLKNSYFNKQEQRISSVLRYKSLRTRKQLSHIDTYVPLLQ